MKTQTVLCFISLAVSGIADAQEGPGGKSLSSTMDVYVFPKEGQQADQQSKDEASCYEWAVTNSDSDPFDLRKQQVREAEQTEEAKAAAEKTGQGAGVRGALRGAAAGAVIGEIADDDASEGAAIGAAAGAIRSRRKGREARVQATATAEKSSQQKQQATAEQLENFKKAFSVCLEAKDYMVKY